MPYIDIKTPRCTFKVFVNEDYTFIPPIKNFLKYLDTKQYSPNTLTTYSYHLKILWDYFKEKGLTYDCIFENGSSNAIKILADFERWLYMPDTSDKIIKFEPKRSVPTVNLIMVTVIEFYKYLGQVEKMGNPEFMKTTFSSRRLKGFLAGMANKSMKQKTNIFKIKETKEEIKYITREQFDILIENCNSTRDKVIVALGFLTGLRCSEILNLRIQDIDLRKNKVNVVPRDDNENGARVKNHSSGSVYFPAQLTMLLVDLINERTDWDNDYLIIHIDGDKKGKPLRRNNIESIFQKLSKRSGINVHCHMLRHGFAVERINNGYSIYELQKDLRHKSIESTMIYAEFLNAVKEEKAREFFQKIGEDFAPDYRTFEELGEDLL